MADSTLWWLACGALVAVELLTGSIYLLMLALGLGAGAVAAHLGLSGNLQVLTAALVGAAATVAWHLRRPHATATADAGTRRDVNLDVGETVQVEHWQPDGHTTVKYRGAAWQATGVPGQAGQPGPHRIVEVRGSQLVIEKISS